MKKKKKNKKKRRREKKKKKKQKKKRKTKKIKKVCVLGKKYLFTLLIPKPLAKYLPLSASKLAVLETANTEDKFIG